jgi:hypothetical protein
MKTVTLVARFLMALTPTSIAGAATDPPFYGIWSCTMMNEGNTVNIADWWQERFDERGVLTEGSREPEKLAVRRLRPANYELTYADGGKARIVMKESWIFLRQTDEHRYLCLRKSAQ